MRSINFSKLKSSLTGWNAAAYLLTEYLRSPQKADGLLDALPFPDGSSARAQAQSLFLGAIRQGHRTRSMLHNFLKKTPRPEVQAIFLIAGHELFNSPPEKKPKIVHHAVERAKESLSKPEANLINAVLRKLPEAFESIDQENLAQYYSHPNWLVKQWTDLFDAVMLDTPCSNTGVIQRRTDVKWRLTRDDISHCTHLQSQLLHSAARFVKKGGRLVYSTCSIEQVENKNIIEHFLDSRSGEAFSLEKSVQSYPWDSGHDGAGATLLVRNTD